MIRTSPLRGRGLRDKEGKTSCRPRHPLRQLSGRHLRHETHTRTPEPLPALWPSRFGVSTKRTSGAVKLWLVLVSRTTPSRRLAGTVTV